MILVLFITVLLTGGVSDSLRNEMDRCRTDTCRIRILEELFWTYRRTSTDTALLVAEECLELSSKSRHARGIANSLYHIGIIRLNRDEYFMADTCFRSALKIYTELDDPDARANCYTEMANLYNRQGNYEEAVGYLFNAQKIYEESGSRSKLARIYSLLGNIFMLRDQHEKAVEYHDKSLAINRDLIFRLGMSVNYNNLGNAYRKMDRYEEALENYKKAAVLKREIGDLVGLSPLMNNIGLAYAESGRLDSALIFHLEARDLYLRNGDKSGIAASDANLAYDHLLGQTYDSSIYYARKALESTLKLHNIRAVTECYRILAGAYAGKGLYRQAYEYHLLHSDYLDSLNRQDVLTRIMQMENNLINQQAQKEIALLNAEKSKQQLRMERQRSQRNLLIAALAVFLAAVLYLVFSYRNRKRINRELQRINETKSRFFANISHEFRTPLTLILGPLEQLSGSNDEKDRQTAAMMYRNARRLLFLNNQLLELARLEAGSVTLRVRKESLTDALKEMVYSFQSLADYRGIELTSEFPAGDDRVPFDRDKLEKVIFNLLSNALKFTPREGKVVFRASLVEGDQKHDLPPKARKIPGKVLHITVSDTGTGIDPKHLHRIFDRFFREEVSGGKSYEGTGLGLALTREMVEIYRGFITVESQVGKGSSFQVFLPADEKAFYPEEYQAADALESEVPGATAEECEDSQDRDVEDGTGTAAGTIPKDHELLLVVEDHPDMRLYIRECLSDYQVVEAENGRIGLEKSQELIPDLIISDLMMPVMDGIDLCRELKNDHRTSHIPVILLTALDTVEDRIRGLETGADDYLAKPFHRKELVARIQNLISQRRMLRERFSRELKIQPGEIAVTPADELFIKRLLSMIENNLADPDLGVDHLMNEAHLSRSQLHRKLKALTGHSATEFIRTVRLKRAAQLLQQQHGTVAETAYAVGFNSLSYFSKCFQKQFGVAPRDYSGQ